MAGDVHQFKVVSENYFMWVWPRVSLLNLEFMVRLNIEIVNKKRKPLLFLVLLKHAQEFVIT